jgi:hypothetical protein
MLSKLLLLGYSSALSSEEAMMIDEIADMSLVSTVSRHGDLSRAKNGQIVPKGHTRCALENEIC